MNRALSGYSDTSSIDEETLLQQELARLQRQYRVMENERKEVSDRDHGWFLTEGSIQVLAKTRDPRIKTGWSRTEQSGSGLQIFEILDQLRPGRNKSKIGPTRIETNNLQRSFLVQDKQTRTRKSSKTRDSTELGPVNLENMAVHGSMTETKLNSRRVNSRSA